MNEAEKRPEIKVIGIEKRTTNKDYQAMQDIPPMWEQWFGKNLAESISNKIGEDIVMIYTNYTDEKHHGAYQCILGVPVSSLDYIPEGMVGITIPAGNYLAVEVDAPEQVPDAWMDIWQDDELTNRRAYTADYEWYTITEDKEQPDITIYLAQK